MLKVLAYNIPFVQEINININRLAFVFSALLVMHFFFPISFLRLSDPSHIIIYSHHVLTSGYKEMVAQVFQQLYVYLENM